MNDEILKMYVDEIFLVYDKDRSGFLDASELAGFFNDIFAMFNDPRRMNQAQAEATLRGIDQNYDGRADKY